LASKGRQDGEPARARPADGAVKKARHLTASGAVIYRSASDRLLGAGTGLNVRKEACHCGAVSRLFQFCFVSPPSGPSTPPPRTYICAMPTSKKPPKQTLRTWRVSLLRSRAIPLGTVEAPDEKAAEAAAVAQFGLDDEQRRRIAVREQE
jgi:hypothetical protein